MIIGVAGAESKVVDFGLSGSWLGWAQSVEASPAQSEIADSLPSSRYSVVGIGTR